MSVHSELRYVVLEGKLGTYTILRNEFEDLAVFSDNSWCPLNSLGVDSLGMLEGVIHVERVITREEEVALKLQGII